MGTFSVVLLALVDAGYKSLAVGMSAYGSNSDGGILIKSSLGRALAKNTLNMPPPATLPPVPELGKLSHAIVVSLENLPPQAKLR